MTENIESPQHKRRAKFDVNPKDVIVVTAIVTATVIATKTTMEVAAELCAPPLRKLSDKLRKKAEKLEEENKKA